MSDLPTPDITPLDYQLPPQKERLTWQTILAWVVIAACVAFIVLAQYAPEIRGRKRAPAGGPMKEAQLELAARYAVGVHHLFKGLAPTTAPGGADPSAQLSDMLGAQAKAPIDQFHAAIAAGELLGAGAAIKQLDAIKPTTAPVAAAPDPEDLATARAIYSGNSDTISSESRGQLVEHHGWFGKLALSFDKPATDPDRAQVLVKADKTVIGLVGFVALIGLLLLAGLVLLIVAIVKLVSGNVQLAGTAPHVGGGPFVEAFALYLLIYIGLSIVLGLLKVESLSASIALVALTPLAWLWPVMRGVRSSECRNALGWHTGKGIFRELGCGLVGYITGIPIVALGFLVTFLLMSLTKSQPSHPLVGEVGKMNPLTIYALACGVAPILEESMFRGALLHHLRTRWNWILSALVVSLIFAAIHPQGWTFIPTLGAIAFVLAALREWRGSLLAPIVAHAMTNFLTVTLLLVALG